VQYQNVLICIGRTKLALPPKSTTDQSIVVTQMDHANAYSDCWSNSTSTLFTEESKECEPIVEMPASSELESTSLIGDEEIYHDYIIEDIPTLNLSSQESSYLPMYGNPFEQFDHCVNASTSLVAFHPNATNTHLSKMKNATRLKTRRSM